MIIYKQGDIFKTECQALVNPVNTHGSMCSGLAASFRKKFPANNKFYKTACKLGQVKIGSMFVWEKATVGDDCTIPQRYLINFPTKDDPRKPSEYDYIEKGLEDLANYIIYKDIKSIAIPALGCGLGTLEWEIVSEMIERQLSYVSEKYLTIIEVYEPQNSFYFHIK